MTEQERDILLALEMEPLDNAVLTLKIMHLNYIRAQRELKELVAKNAQRQMVKAIHHQKYTGLNHTL